MKLIFSSLHHLSFLFPFSISEPSRDLSPISRSAPNPHHCWSSGQTSPFILHFIQWSRLLFVQDPSILWSETLSVTAMPNVWRRANLLLPLVPSLYSKLLNISQVFLSLIVIVFVPCATDEFRSLWEGIYTWNKSFRPNVCWEQNSVEIPRHCSQYDQKFLWRVK